MLDENKVAAVKSCMPNFVISDPRHPDNPIIFASPGFTQMTGYSLKEAPDPFAAGVGCCCGLGVDLLGELTVVLPLLPLGRLSTRTAAFYKALTPTRRRYAS